MITSLSAFPVRNQETKKITYMCDYQVIYMFITII